VKDITSFLGIDPEVHKQKYEYQLIYQSLVIITP